MAITAEVRAAVGDLTAWPAADAGREARVGGLAAWPAVGLALGGLAAAVAAATGGLGPLPASTLAVVVRELCLGRHGRPAALGWLGALATTAVEIGALASLSPPARSTALLLAPMVGRWAAVVQCYGGVPATPEPDAPWIGRARFREFGVASVTAIGGMLVALDAVGLLAVLAAAGVMLAVRLAAYRWTGGMRGRLVRATAALVEVVVVCVLAAVGRALATR